MPEAVTLPVRNLSDLQANRPVSARAALLVLFGEYVWPTDRPVWSSVLLEAMAELGFEEAASRRSLQRLSSQGLIDNHRRGRQVQWRITPAGHEFFVAGENRVLKWTPRVTSWDGRWLFVAVTVPDDQRRLRRPLNAALEWAGLGQTRSGLWITPHADRADEVEPALATLGLTDQATSIVGRPGVLGASPASLVAQAWDIEGLGMAYEEFINSIPKSPATAPERAWAQRLDLVRAWRRFPFLDPRLPEEFLPADWPGFTAEERYRARRAELSPAAWTYWENLMP